MELVDNGNELKSINISNIDELSKKIKSNKIKMIIVAVAMVFFLLTIIKCIITVVTCDYVYADYSEKYEGYYYRFSDEAVTGKYGDTGQFKEYSGLPVYLVPYDECDEKGNVSHHSRENKCYVLLNNNDYTFFPVKLDRIKLYYKDDIFGIKPLEGLYESVAAEAILLLLLYILVIKNKELKREITRYENEK